MQAWVQVIKMEREEQERQRQKEEDERRRKRESEKRIKRLLEAAFDGDNDEILTMFDEVSCTFFPNCLAFHQSILSYVFIVCLV